MRPESYLTPTGIAVTRTVSKAPYAKGLDALRRKLDTQRGVYLSSGYEYPERYSRWDIAALTPPIEIVATGRDIVFRPLNKRGEILNQILEPLLAPHPHWESFALENGALHGTLKPLPELFSEEQRSKQPSAFSVLRTLIDEFKNPLASRLLATGRLNAGRLDFRHREAARIAARPSTSPLLLLEFLVDLSNEWVRSARGKRQSGGYA